MIEHRGHRVNTELSRQHMSQAVVENLSYYNNWTDVDTVRCQLPHGLIQGSPPDSPHATAWVVPCVSGDLSPSDISLWFAAVESASSERPSRVTAAIIASDGTIVYYHVYDGVTVPSID